MHYMYSEVILERLLGQLTLENALRKKALLRLEARCRERASTGGS